jgi:hypothetical protein
MKGQLEGDWDSKKVYTSTSQSRLLREENQRETKANNFKVEKKNRGEVDIKSITK